MDILEELCPLCSGRVLLKDYTFVPSWGTRRGGFWHTECRKIFLKYKEQGLCDDDIRYLALQGIN